MTILAPLLCLCRKWLVTVKKSFCHVEIFEWVSNQLLYQIRIFAVRFISSNSLKWRFIATKTENHWRDVLEVERDKKKTNRKYNILGFAGLYLKCLCVSSLNYHGS